MSSLGKGLASAALGSLLQARGFTVRLRKLDPYLNVDPGTMSPFEHGEVFVTDDGAETDLDLGHYERFTGVAATQSDSISSGRIYTTVLEKERRGDYLGKTIQVIPHVTDEIKNFLHIGSEDVNFMLCEIGGTVGDIEGLPFLEAIRQFSYDNPKKCIFMHLTLLPYIEASGELKTKPTQHSVKELRAIGIAPDVLVCRSVKPLPEKEREKLTMFCSVRSDQIVSALDMDSIYKAPLEYHNAGLDTAVMKAFGIRKSKKTLKKWQDIAKRIDKPDGTVHIGIVGKYTELEDAYKSISEALIHGGIANRVKVKTHWINAESLEKNIAYTQLGMLGGILVPGGFGERGTEGKIKAAEYARVNNIPYFGICLGMQLAVIETARNLAGVADAGSAEFWEDHCEHVGTPPQGTPIVYHMKEWGAGNRTETRNIGDDKGGTMRLGAYDAVLEAGSQVARIYGDKDKDAVRISERHRHRYEVDIAFKDTLEGAGLRISGLSPDGRLPEIVERVDHPWFIGVQFHPELKSKPLKPHPLFVDFIRAANKKLRLL